MLTRAIACTSCLGVLVAGGCRPFPEIPDVTGASTSTEDGNTSTSGGTGTTSGQTSSSSFPNGTSETSSASPSDTSTSGDVSTASDTSATSDASTVSDTSTAGDISTSSDASTSGDDDGDASTSGDDDTGAGTTTAESSTTLDPADASSSEGSTGDDECPTLDTRCEPHGRQRCEQGAWIDDPCPAHTPTCEAGACVVRGPTMVSAGTYLIDSTEVTVAQYRAFLDDRNGDTSGQTSQCAWNTEFWNETHSMNADEHPVTYVDWCDAQAFCAWAGKRLCGRIDGGAIPRADLIDAQQSQWFRGCGGPNGLGQPQTDAVCNDDGDLAAVGSHPECEGYHAGLFDMVGNVQEWVDSCDASVGADDTCYVVGGSYIDESWCDQSPHGTSRSTTARPFGFRCCGA